MVKRTVLDKEVFASLRFKVRSPEGCITDRKNTMMEGTSWKWKRIEAPFEVGQGPEGAVAPHVDGRIEAWDTWSAR